MVHLRRWSILRATTITTTTTTGLVITDDANELFSSIVVITVLIVVATAVLCCLCTSLYAVVVAPAVNYCLTVTRCQRRFGRATEVSLKRSSIFSSRGRRLHGFRSLSWSINHDQSPPCPTSEYRLKLLRSRPFAARNLGPKGAAAALLPQSPSPPQSPPSPPSSQLGKVVPMAPHSAADHTGPYMPALKFSCSSSSTTTSTTSTPITSPSPILEGKSLVPATWTVDIASFEESGLSLKMNSPETQPRQSL